MSQHRPHELRQSWRGADSPRPPTPYPVGPKTPQRNHRPRETQAEKLPWGSFRYLLRDPLDRRPSRPKSREALVQQEIAARNAEINRRPILPNATLRPAGGKRVTFQLPEPTRRRASNASRLDQDGLARDFERLDLNNGRVHRCRLCRQILT